MAKQRKKRTGAKVGNSTTRMTSTETTFVFKMFFNFFYNDSKKQLNKKWISLNCDSINIVIQLNEIALCKAISDNNNRTTVDSA